jgi:hypothetical protein
MDSVITSQAQKSAQLTEANKEMWAGIPGTYDLELDWIHYFYNCTNYEDVLFKNAAPKFKEFGPYTYREYDTFDNLTWANNTNYVNGEQETAVNATYNQYTEFKEDAMGNID